MIAMMQVNKSIPRQERINQINVTNAVLGAGTADNDVIIEKSLEYEDKKERSINKKVIIIPVLCFLAYILGENRELSIEFIGIKDLTIGAPLEFMTVLISLIAANLGSDLYDVFENSIFRHEYISFKYSFDNKVALDIKYERKYGDVFHIDVKFFRYLNAFFLLLSILLMIFVGFAIFSLCIFVSYYNILLMFIEPVLDENLSFVLALVSTCGWLIFLGLILAIIPLLFGRIRQKGSL